MGVCLEKLLPAQPCIEYDGIAAVAVGDYIGSDRGREIQTDGLDVIINHWNHFPSYGPSFPLQSRCLRASPSGRHRREPYTPDF